VNWRHGVCLVSDDPVWEDAWRIFRLLLDGSLDVQVFRAKEARDEYIRISEISLAQNGPIVDCSSRFGAVDSVISCVLSWDCQPGVDINTRTVPYKVYFICPF
jgi:hypothetical protein